MEHKNNPYKIVINNIEYDICNFKSILDKYLLSSYFLMIKTNQEEYIREGEGISIEQKFNTL